MTLVNPFAALMLFSHIAAYRLSGHTAAASSVGWPVPSAWHGTALHSGRSGRHQCTYGEGACRQADDHRFGQHGCSAEPSIVLENGPSFALVNRTRHSLHRSGHKRATRFAYNFEDGKVVRRPASPRARFHQGNVNDAQGDFGLVAGRRSDVIPPCPISSPANNPATTSRIFPRF
jgi:hypothetical protein